MTGTLKSKSILYLTVFMMMLCVIIISVSITVSATSSGTYGNFYYTLSEDNQITITNCSQSVSGAITIPNRINGYPVTKIDDEAFYCCYDITSLTIPNSVSYIGEKAFGYCESLTNIIIPEGVERIGYYAFMQCENLSEVTISDGVGVIEDRAFSDCTALTKINMLGAREIGNYAFYDCTKLNEITFSDSVVKIGSSAFENCSAIATINIESVASWCNITFVDTYSNPIRYGKKLFINSQEIKELVIPNTVNKIKERAFCGSSITSVKIPQSVKNIEYAAFQSCTSLKSIEFAEGIEYIGNYVFFNCTSIENVTIPSSVLSIGETSFCLCSNLRSVDIKEGVKRIENSAFSSCYNLENVTIPTSIINVGLNAFYGTKWLANNDERFLVVGDGVLIQYNGTSSTVTIPSTVKYINCKLAENGEIITKINIPDTVLEIGNGAFTGCTDITTITIPNSVTNIGTSAFSGCTNLKSVILSDNINNISDSLFYGCTSIESLKIPKSVTNIGYAAFCDCTALISIEVPSNVVSLGDRAFEGCSNLSSVTLPNNISDIGTETFSETKWLKNNTEEFMIVGDGILIKYSGTERQVTIPNTVKNISCKMDDNNAYITNVTIPDSVEKIGANAFSYCSYLKNVIIEGNGLKSIGSWAFYSSTSLSSIKSIPSSVENIGYNAFYYAGSPTIYYEGTKEEWMELYTYSSNIVTSTIAATEIIIDKEQLNLAIGDKETIIATMQPNNVTLSKNHISWSSSNTDIATVSNGIVTAKSEGKATITAEIYTQQSGQAFYSTGIKKSCTVVVNNPQIDVSGISLNKENTTLTVGDTETLIATILPSNATDKTISWESSNANVATVTNGVVTAKKVGTTTITATSGDGKQTATCVVTVDYKVKISVFDYQVIGTYVLIDLSVENMTDTATLYFATYDESGRMLEIQTPTLTDGSTRIILPLGTVHKIKAFVWEDNLQPIARFAEKIL